MKLNAKSKTLLENKIYKLIKESFFENSFFEKKDDESKEKDEEPREDSNKENLIMRWLDSEQELHSILAYKLWPDKDEDSARSLFSKKWRGHDDSGKKYSFDPEEINNLYNLRSDFISDARLKGTVKKS